MTPKKSDDISQDNSQAGDNAQVATDKAGEGKALRKQFKDAHKDADFHACHLTENEIAHLRKSIGFPQEHIADEP